MTNYVIAERYPRTLKKSSKEPISKQEVLIYSHTAIIMHVLKIYKASSLVMIYVTMTLRL